MKNILLIVLLVVTASCLGQRRAYKNVTEKDGKIGIGTKAPDELLTVKGTIHTQEVRVDLEGAVAPDYVFEEYFDGSSLRRPDYSRLSLGELEAYLEQHGHLPGIAPATELEAEGLELKAMNLLLLEKIEELTLYTLEQQKQLDALKEELQQLKNPN